jgi:hypothetical protein
MPPEEKHHYCPAHIELVTHLAEMKTSLGNIEKSLADDAGFKRGIIIAFVGVFLSMVAQALYIGDRWGRLSNQVDVNTKKWDMHDGSYADMKRAIQSLQEHMHTHKDVTVK